MTSTGALPEWLRTGVRRLRGSIPAILQITVTAVAAVAFAQIVLGHPQPIVAAIVAINALGFARVARPLGVLETVVAMSLGIALAEVLLLAFGAGLLQYALALVLTLAVARLVTGNAVYALAAAVQCSLVMLVSAPAGGPFTRTLDAVVGGVFALVATAVIPRDPRTTAAHDGRRLIEEHVAVLQELSTALGAGDQHAAGLALSRARATQPLVDEWTGSVDSGLAIVRVSPLARRSRFDLQRQRVMLTGLEQATRNLRVLARRIEWQLRDGRPRAEIAELLRRIALSLGPLADSLSDVSAQPIARQSLSEILRNLDPEHFLPETSVSDRNTLHALPPYLVDLLRATGLSLDEARALLPPTV